MNIKFYPFVLCFFGLFSCQLKAQINEGSPVFHGASVIGNRPNTPFSYFIPVTGKQPMQLQVLNLPLGWTFDPEKRIIEGNAADKATYNLTFLASNDLGKTEKQITVEIGDKLCLTPPLGWNSWNVFTTDINEKMLMEIADAMVATGMRDMGYQYINIDDFWHADARDAQGKPVVDAAKFPNGMKHLADYVHSKGLKLGIYSCAGDKTCGKRFGGFGYEEIDAKTYAEWGIDLLKYDYCFAPWGKKAALERYAAIGTALKNSGRSIVLSICEWGLRKPWKWGSSVEGSYWRITPDIFDVWQKPAIWQYSVMNIVNRTEKLSNYATAGSWNDMDMLLVGNNGMGKATAANGKYKGLSELEYQSHMSLWAMFCSPLLSSCDLRSIDALSKKILMNSQLLAIHQDKLGKQANVVAKKKGVRVYKKELENGYALAIFNTSNKEKEYVLKNEDLPLDMSGENVWTDEKYASIKQLKLILKPHETIVLKLNKPL